MTILDFASKLNISLTDEQKSLLTAWEKSYLKNETYVVSMPRYCGRQASLNLIQQYLEYCRGREEATKEFAAKIKSHMIKYCHSRLEQQYCAMEVIDYIGKLMGEKDYSMDVETEMKKHDEAIRVDERAKVFEWITGTSHITCDEGEWYLYDTEAQEWHHTKVEELLELYDKRLEEGENK